MIDVIKDLKKKFQGEFYITPSVKYELVDKPLKTRIYGLEAMLVTKLIEEGYLKILKPKTLTKEIENIANHIYNALGRDIQILQSGEIEALALSIEIGADAFIIDERTTRVLIEEPNNLKDLLQRKLHTKIIVNRESLKKITKLTNKLRILRSTEIMFVAYEKGLLNNYISHTYDKKDQVEAVLWGMRSKGCSISIDEIEKAKKLI
jgi:hypothetical protein